MEFYFDAEFDAIRRYEGCVQCLVSIGIVAAQDGAIIDTFYSLIQPKRFRRLTRVVKEMTQLRNEEIREAPSFYDVMDAVQVFMDSLCEREQRKIYSFGPDDKRTIHSHAAYEKGKQITMFDSVIDLQKQLSAQITYQNVPISNTLSLDDLKYVYEVEGEVVHNALNDALDLMRIHQASKIRKPDCSRVKEIYARKEKKRLEVKAKAQARMQRILQERYGHYDGMRKEIPCYPAILEQLEFLSDQKEFGELHFGKRFLYVHADKYAYDVVQLHLHWQFSPSPSMILELKIMDMHQDVEIALNYRNAGIFDEIWKNAQK